MDGRFRTLQAGQCQELFVGLNALSEDLSVSKQRIRGDRRGRMLGSLFVGDMNRFEWNIVFFRHLPHSRNPIAGEGALISVVEHEPVFAHRRMLSAFLELRQRRTLFKRQSHEVDAAIGDVRNLKALMVLGTGLVLMAPR